MALTKAKLQEQFDNSEYDLGVGGALFIGNITDSGATDATDVNTVPLNKSFILRLNDMNSAYGFADWGHFFQVYGSGDTLAQMIFPYSTQDIYFRTGTNSNITSASWTRIQKAITSGTGAPSGGSSGDIYIKYS